MAARARRSSRDWPGARQQRCRPDSPPARVAAASLAAEAATVAFSPATLCFVQRVAAFAPARPAAVVAADRSAAVPRVLANLRAPRPRSTLRKRATELGLGQNFSS